MVRLGTVRRGKVCCGKACFCKDNKKPYKLIKWINKSVRFFYVYRGDILVYKSSIVNLCQKNFL